MQHNWGKVMTYLFHRLIDGKSGFYPVQLKDDTEVLSNVECNPGTLKVTTPDSRVVWSIK